MKLFLDDGGSLMFSVFPDEGPRAGQLSVVVFDDNQEETEMVAFDALVELEIRSRVSEIDGLSFIRGESAVAGAETIALTFERAAARIRSFYDEHHVD